ncbi:hypothetical protein BAUCODRAFT_320194 [Baudoinia panamericana UAMH 10762]|uniref:Uncharacterized protein n=1 Tax=Baudoinia panamericana (strain UAMH 10762) TaxID=717646 RepID=M2MJ17_BAUPA|nr:uncharacterized protein BAUCODRAFT_320194 [Baudoinia panamericana UAMH 10762]EMC91268.1 hypothetical protein BAUCODRAFT_320194 [Baudoinia panamericana UAMH 10762]
MPSPDQFTDEPYINPDTIFLSHIISKAAILAAPPKPPYEQELMLKYYRDGLALLSGTRLPPDNHKKDDARHMLLIVTNAAKAHIRAFEQRFRAARGPTDFGGFMGRGDAGPETVAKMWERTALDIEEWLQQTPEAGERDAWWPIFFCSATDIGRACRSRRSSWRCRHHCTVEPERW